MVLPCHHHTCMTNVTGTQTAPVEASSSADAPAGWQALRADGAIQFEPVDIPAPEARVPGWFERLLNWIGELISPLGQLLGVSWPVLKWVLIALLVLAVAALLWRIFGPLLGLRIERSDDTADEVEWQPDRAESIALLEDADHLAAEGKYDEAVHLLLQRSVAQIASAKPDWVVPASTARELAALPALSEAARAAFGTISERVERSLFALRALDRTDWDAARAAYADFALARIEASPDRIAGHDNALAGEAAI